MYKIILASQSPRRKMLLEWAAITFEVLVQPTDEHYPANLPITEIPIHIAKEKANVTQGCLTHEAKKDSLIIAADTIVVLGDEVIGKPANREEAIRTLHKLSNKKHQVITGVVLLTEDREVSFADITEVEFHPLSEEQICFYVDQYQPYDKAGAYAIQEWIGVVGIKKVCGDFYNVMGLPVSKVLQAIESFN